MCPSPNPSPSSSTDIWTGPIPPCIPPDAISQAAFSYAATHLHPLILAHSLRVFLLAHSLSTQESRPWHLAPRLPLLLTACLFHDLGTAPAHATQPLRFEIEGADAARAFLAAHHVPLDDQDEVWRAITLHNTPQVADRFPGPGLVRLVRWAVAADFRRADAVARFETADVQRWEAEFPRGEIEKVLGERVVEQAVRCPEKAPGACWPGGLYRAYLAEPEWTGVNKAF